MTNIQFAAPCLFGLESIAGDELRRLNVENVRVEDRRVLFTGDIMREIALPRDVHSVTLRQISSAKQSPMSLFGRQSM